VGHEPPEQGPERERQTQVARAQEPEAVQQDDERGEDHDAVQHLEQLRDGPHQGHGAPGQDDGDGDERHGGQGRPTEARSNRRRPV
jgi:hypothetical protein